MIASRLTRDRRRAAGAAAAILACAVLTGCPAGGGGGSDNGGMLGGGLQAVFTADNATPQPLTLSMAPGTPGTDSFQVRVLVTDIRAVFGAAFRVAFDASLARFDGFSDSGSFIAGAGVTTDFRAVVDPANAGVILVAATRQGQLAGVDAVGSQLLITLNFTATAATTGSAFTFAGAATRRVTTCPAPPAACTDVADGALVWSGGTLMSN